MQPCKIRILLEKVTGSARTGYEASLAVQLWSDEHVESDKLLGERSYTMQPLDDLLIYDLIKNVGPVEKTKTWPAQLQGRLESLTRAIEMIKDHPSHPCKLTGELLDAIMARQIRVQQEIALLARGQ